MADGQLWRRRWVGALAFAFVLSAGPGRADDVGYSEQWGPSVGTRLPMLDALDQDGQRRDFENLSGEHGLLLFFSRSTDW